MQRNSIYTNVEKATVTLLGKGGQGVLISGNLIITAAHCIKVSCNMALKKYSIEKIKTGKRVLKVTTLAVEPISDLAVLGSPEEEDFPEDVKG